MTKVFPIKSRDLVNRKVKVNGHVLESPSPIEFENKDEKIKDFS
jgi:hypothetical protein